MVSARTLALVLLGAVGPAAAGDDRGPPGAPSPWEMPPAGQDFSAFRIDCDVFGWNRDFTQVGAVGTEVRRGPLGRHRGDAYLLVYPVGSTELVHNVSTHSITQADLPHDPVPLDDARTFLWTIERSFQEMWPKRPIRKQPRGGMGVEMLWEAAPIGPDMCQPAVGFLLTYQGKHRYVPYQALDLQVSCALLRHTDVRTYWGRPDVVASMVRFDYAPDVTHEASTRFVVSTAWRLGRALQVRIDSPWAASSAAASRLRASLQKLGTVAWNQIPGQPPAGQGQSYAIAFKSELRLLATHLRRNLDSNASLQELPAGAGPDLIVRVVPAGSRPDDAPGPPPRTAPAQAPADSEYIKDWTVP